MGEYQNDSPVLASFLRSMTAASDQARQVLEAQGPIIARALIEFREALTPK